MRTCMGWMQVSAFGYFLYVLVSWREKSIEVANEIYCRYRKYQQILYCTRADAWLSVYIGPILKKRIGKLQQKHQKDGGLNSNYQVDVRTSSSSCSISTSTSKASTGEEQVYIKYIYGLKGGAVKVWR